MGYEYLYVGIQQTVTVKTDRKRDRVLGGVKTSTYTTTDYSDTYGYAYYSRKLPNKKKTCGE